MDQDYLRQQIYLLVKETGIKKSFIAQSINENPNNFSRWLTKKRNYGPERESQIKTFLIERGYLDDG